MRRPLQTAILAAMLAGAMTGAVPAMAAPAAWCELRPQESGAASAVLARARQQLAASPHALAVVHTEGTLPHEAGHIAALEARRDFPIMRDAAMAWRLSGEPRYLAQVDAFLLAWATNYVPTFNPVDETNFEPLMLAYTLTREALTPATRSAADRLLRTLAEGYIERAATRSDPHKPPTSGVWINNWQSHRIKLMALAAAALQDVELMRQVERRFMQQISDNVRPDGRVFDFEERDALRYVVYDLEPLALAALAAQPFGHRWLTAKASNGASLAGALQWLTPYAQGERQHQEFANTRVPFDRQRAQAGVPGFSGIWQPAGAATLYWLAARLDPAYQALARQLDASGPDWLALCRTP